MEELKPTGSLRDYGPAAPEGPNMNDEHVASANIHDMNLNEESVFNAILKPDDMYDSNGVYWADMPLMRKIKFVLGVDARESALEWRWFVDMVKKDPLSPIGFYFRNMVIPGMGLGLEG
jgi:hypothetical protein